MMYLHVRLTDRFYLISLLLFLVLATIGLMPAIAQDVQEVQAFDTLRVVELDRGETLRFTLINGQVREIVLEDAWAQMVLSNLDQPKRGQINGWSVYRMGVRVRIDGQPMTMLRFSPVQSSFYEPYVVNGMRIWFDGVRELGELFNENHGQCLPRKTARFAIQDATLPINSEEELMPWYPNPHNRIDIRDTFEGGNPWMGPYRGADLHGGLDVNKLIGTPIWAPISFDTQRLHSAFARGQNNNRWRGTRTWGNGQTWVLQAHHLTDLLVPENVPVAQGTHYADGAGGWAGDTPHSHFYFRVREDDREYVVDPWILFWQIFENNRDRANEIRAYIVPIGPAATGQILSFSAEGSRPGVTGRHLTYFWSFGDGGAAFGPEPTYTYARPGVYPVTLIISDGANKHQVVHHVTVNGDPVDAPMLVLSAPSDSEFTPRSPSAVDAYNDPLRHIPHTLGFMTRWPNLMESPTKRVDLVNLGGGELGAVTWRIEYLQRTGWADIRLEGEGNDQYLLISVRADGELLRENRAARRDLAVVYVEAENAVGPPQVFVIDHHRPWDAPAGDVVVHVDDDRCYLTPGYWLRARYQHPWPKGHGGGDFLISSGVPGERGVARFQPNLLPGRYRVSFTDQTPFQIIARCSQEPRFRVRVRHRDGENVIWVQPTLNRTIGEFDFNMGMDGYVQIESDDATGVIVADALRFQQIDPDSQ